VLIGQVLLNLAFSAVEALSAAKREPAAMTLAASQCVATGGLDCRFALPLLPFLRL
jgi:hypothetical protein